MAAGQDLEPYWEVYRQHLRGHVVTWMEVRLGKRGILCLLDAAPSY